MTPEEIQLALMGVQFLIKEVPIVESEIRTLLSKPNPTPQDWSDLRTRVAAATYETLVPNSALNTAPPIA